MRVIGIGYRDWAISIYKNLSKKKINIKIIKKKNISLKDIKKHKPQIILFYGWSKKVTKEERAVSNESTRPRAAT